jgi:ankyrin repeat protein
MVSKLQVRLLSLEHILTRPPSLETISVIHHSLTEFLKGSTRNPTENSYPILEPSLTHHSLALACLSYLQSVCFNEIPSPAKAASGRRGRTRESRLSAMFHPRSEYHALPAFTKYAANNWHIHARKSMLAGYDQSQINAALDRFVASQDFGKWTRITNIGCDQVTPLFVAVALGLTQYSEVLLARSETNPNRGDMYEPPLYHAAKNGYDDIAYLLVNHGADLNEWDSDGYRALHVAAMHNHSKVVGVLLRAGADPFCTPQKTDKFYDWGLEPSGTPISKACSYGHVDTVAVLLPYLKTEEAVTNALFIAASAGQPAVVALLLTHPLADVNKQQGSQSLLYVACSKRDSRSIKLLLEAGADPNTKIIGFSDYREGPEDSGYTALHALASGGCVRNGSAYGRYSSNHPPEETIEAFELMLQAGANVHQLDPSGQNALFHASDGVAARILLDAGVSPYVINQDEETLLHGHYKLDILRHLLERAQIDTSRKLPYWETTPLLKSLKDGNVKKALLLLEFGADCSGCDDDGNGAFHLAVAINYRDQNKGLQGSLFTQLRGAGAEVNMKNKSGCTPLHTLDFRNFNEKLFTLLLEAGLDTEAKNGGGETALFSALRDISDYERPILCDKLVKAGCNISAVDNKGRNLLHALKSTDPKVIQYLVEKGLNPKQTDDAGNTLWHVAAESYFNAKLFPELLALDLDPEQPNHSGGTPLHVFSRMRPQALDSYSFKNVSPTKIAETTPFDVFLEYITRIDPADTTGVTPLHLASTFSEYLTKRLLEVGADPVRCTAERLTVFHLAARSRQPNILGVLLDFCKRTKNPSALAFTLNAKDKFGRTAIFYACASGCLETVKMLIEAGATVNSDQYDASAWQGCVEFEEESKNWKFRYRADGQDYDWSAPRAEGVTIADKTRPDVREAHHDSTGFKHRIDEITKLLSCYEAFTRKFLHNALQDAVSRKLDYTVACLIGLRTRFDIVISEALDAEVDACLRRRELSMGPMSSFPVSLRHRNFALATEQLTQSALLNFDGYGQPLLHQLVHDGFVSILERVLTPEIAQKLDDMNWCREREEASRQHRRGCIRPLLITACQRDLPNLDMIRFLVERMGVNVNAQTRINEQVRDRSDNHILHESALHYLVRGMNWWQTRQALPYLVGKGANVNLKDRDDITPLRASLDRMKTVLFHKHPIEILVNAGADVNSVNKQYGRRGTSCLSQASDDTEMTKYLLERGAVVTHFDIRNVILKGCCDALELFLSHGGDPDSRDTLGTQFEDRSYLDNDDSGSMNRKIRRDEAKFPLHYLATIDMLSDVREEMANILLQHGANINACYKDTTLMHCMIKCSRIARLLLIHPDLNIEATDAEGCTLLLAASQEQGQTQYSDTSKDTGTSLVRVLMNRGANIRARDHNGKNALHQMLSDQSLLQGVPYYTRVPPRDADVGYIATLAPSLVNEQDNNGNTPLHYATEKHIKFVSSLLDAGADPRTKNNKGDTALHHLVRGQWTVDINGEISGVRRKLFDRLLALGADFHARNHRAETPIFNFFRNHDSPQADVGPDETIPKEQRKAYQSRDGSLEVPLYNLFEKMGVNWADVDVDDQSLLHVVATAERYNGGGKALNRFKFLMSKGLDVSAEDKKRRTPLDIAAAFGNADILDLFKKEALGG